MAGARDQRGDGLGLEAEVGGMDVSEAQPEGAEAFTSLSKIKAFSPTPACTVFKDLLATRFTERLSLQLKVLILS